QHCMAEAKKKQSSHVEDQSQHLEKIKQQLQAYLVAQYKQQQKLQEQFIKSQSSPAATAKLPDPVQPAPELSDYLYAQGLLDKYQQDTGKDLVQQLTQSRPVVAAGSDTPTAELPAGDTVSE